MSTKKTLTVGLALSVMLTSFAGTAAANATEVVEQNDTTTIETEEVISELEAPTFETTVVGTNEIRVSNFQHNEFDTKTWGHFSDYTVNLINEETGGYGKWTHGEDVVFSNLEADTEYKIEVSYVTNFGYSSVISETNVVTEGLPLEAPYVGFVGVNDYSFEIRPIGYYSQRWNGDLTSWDFIVTNVKTGESTNHQFVDYRPFVINELSADTEYRVEASFTTANGFTSPVGIGTVKTEGEVKKPYYLGTAIVAGNPTVGQTLNVYNTGMKATSYQWLRDGKDIKGATSSTYKLTADDAKKKISARVYGTSPSHLPSTEISNYKLVDYDKISSSAPTISGTVKVGNTLKASAGKWTAGAKLSYQWLRDGKDISKATGTSYKLTTADAGKKISVRVTGSKAGFATVSQTSATKAVPFMSLYAPTPSVSGSVKVGSTVKASVGKWTSGTKLSYQWLRDGKAISKATGSSYKLTTADAGKRISVKVTGSQTGYSTVSKTSGSKTVPYLNLTSSTPKISGSAKVGNTLKASAGKWTAGTSISYQWYSNGKAIKGATKSTYKVSKSDTNKKISVKVTGKKSGYKTATKTSSSTAKVKR